MSDSSNLRQYFSNLKGDKLRYMQVLLNFLSNAIKFTYEGQAIIIRLVLLEVQEVEDKNDDQELISQDNLSFLKNKSQESCNSYIKFAIEIEDSGVGMSKEDQKNIFIDFMKINGQQKMNPQGTGLGLSICKLLVEKMRGKINVESEINNGTTFQIVISSKAKLQSDQLE